MFNPIRYTSLGLAVIEAMMVGLPVVGLATTEMVTVIRHGESGILNTNVEFLIAGMKKLLNDQDFAAKLSSVGRQVVMERFNIDRFAKDWYHVIAGVIREKNVLTPA